MTIIDTHTHAISADTTAYPTDPIGGHQSDWSPAPGPLDADALLRAMDHAGIARAVVVQASTVYGHDNRYVVETVRAHARAFRGRLFDRSHLAADAVAQIDHWQAEGLGRYRLFTTGSTMPGQADWLGHESSYPAWAHAEALGIPVCLQMTMQGSAGQLRTLLERFPEERAYCSTTVRGPTSPTACRMPPGTGVVRPGRVPRRASQAHQPHARRSGPRAAPRPAAFLEKVVTMSMAQAGSPGARTSRRRKAALSTLLATAQDVLRAPCPTTVRSTRSSAARPGGRTLSGAVRSGSAMIIAPLGAPSWRTRRLSAPLKRGELSEPARPARFHRRSRPCTRRLPRGGSRPTTSVPAGRRHPRCRRSPMAGRWYCCRPWWLRGSSAAASSPCSRAHGPLAPQELAGKRIGVRSYTQTTGMWVRAHLAGDYALPIERMRWLTRDGAHVQQYADPGFVEHTCLATRACRTCCAMATSMPPSSATTCRRATSSFRSLPMSRPGTSHGGNAIVSCRSTTCWWPATRPGVVAIPGR